MNRLQGLLAATVLIGCAWHMPGHAADMTFQLINDTERQLSLKFFSRGESRQEWPSKAKAYSIRPEAAIQQLKLSCEEGEPICWGAWMVVQNQSGEITGSGNRANTSTHKYIAGAGDRGQRSCEHCCHICKDGAVTPPMRMKDPNPEAK